MKKKRCMEISLFLFLAIVSASPVAADVVGPGGSIDVDRGGSFEYDTGEGEEKHHTDISEEEESSEEDSESGAQGSTNESWVDDRSQNEKNLNTIYCNLRDLVASWKNKCTGEPKYLGMDDEGYNLSSIQYGTLSDSDIRKAKEMLDSFNDISGSEDVRDEWREYYLSFDLREGGNVYEPTSVPSSSGLDSLSGEDIRSLKEMIKEEEGLSGMTDSDWFLIKTQDALPGGIDFLSEDAFPSLSSSALAYRNGSPVRTDLIDGGLYNSSPGTWYKDIESLYRYLDMETPESMTGTHGKFQSNAMNDFCSIALIKNYRLQNVIKEIEEIGEPVSDDYQIHLFSVDEEGNQSEIDVLETNKRINTIDISKYEGIDKIIAKTYRKFYVTSYTRVSYASYEYLIDTGTRNILWYSEHSVEGRAAGLTSERMVQTASELSVSDWIPDPDEAEITIRDLDELTTDNTVTERVE